MNEPTMLEKLDTLWKMRGHANVLSMKIEALERRVVRLEGALPKSRKGKRS